MKKFAFFLLLAAAVGYHHTFLGSAQTPQIQSIPDSVSAFTLPSGAQIRIVESPFLASRFKVEGCAPPAFTCRINGDVPFGVAAGLPKSYVKSITVTFDGHSHDLDVSDMFNAWSPRPLEVQGVIRYFGGRCSDANNCELRGLFSDAGATFVAEWHIVGGKPMRTVITDSNDIVNLFMKHIDPPELR